MTQTVRHLMDEQTARLVGRDDELGVLRRLLGEGGPLVVFIHGIAGIGKSTLVEAFGVEARGPGQRCSIWMVARSSPRHECSGPRSRPRPAAISSTAEAAAARLSRLGGRVILVIDTYEFLRLLDPWLRQTFVPALSDDVGSSCRGASRR